MIPLEEVFDAQLESLSYIKDLMLEDINLDFYDWLKENEYSNISEELFQEMININTTQWRASMMTLIKGNLDKFKNYSNQQIQKNAGWLQQYRDYILNRQTYPVQPTMHINSAPNYVEALQRVGKPISSNLSSIDLDRIETDSKDLNKDGKMSSSEKQVGNKANLFVKKMFINTYDGSQPYDTYAKMYYYGKDKQIDLRARDIQELLPRAFQYVSNYNAMIRAMEVDANGIISYLNKNPVTGNQDKTITQSDLAMMQNQQAANRANRAGMASTNASVNADTDYQAFMKYFFSDILDEAITTASNSGSAGTVGNTQTADTTASAKGSSSTFTRPKIQQGEIQNDNKASSRNDDQDKQSNDAELYKKKKVVCDIVRDAYNAKITACGMLYRDMMYIMKTHVQTYLKAQQKKERKEQTDRKNQTTQS